MSQRLDRLLGESKSNYAIQHIRKPKWFKWAEIVRRSDSFRVKLWEDVYFIVKDNPKFKGVYKGKGERRKEVNTLGDNIATFTMPVNGLDVSQCFSLYKSVLQNRIDKEGSNDELFIPYEDGCAQGIFMHRKENNEISIQTCINLGEEVIFNGMSISFESGPYRISSLYGIPDFKVHLVKSSSYDHQKSADLGNIEFWWGSDETRYMIDLFVDIAAKVMIFEIIVR